MKVALVTGSTSGIGRAVAEKLAANDYHVVLNSVNSADAGKEMVESIGESRATYIRGDISKPDDVHSIVDDIGNRFGHLNLLVNNAGRTVKIPHSDLDSASTDVWREIFDLNVFGSWNLTTASHALLQKQADSSVVFISSVAGSRPVGSSIPYSVSKAAVEHMTRLLAASLGPGIRVNAVAPGLIRTPWTEDMTAVMEHVEKGTPLRRVGSPADVANAVISIVQSTYTTGAVLSADGGAHLV